MSDQNPPDVAGKRYAGTTAATAEVGGATIEEVARIRIRFADAGGGRTHLRATAGCNQLNGTIAWDGATLTASPLMSTMMMGPEPIMVQERWLTDLLTGAPSVTETVTDTGPGLVITAAVGTLTLVEVPPTPLRGTDWVATGLVTPAAISSLPGDVHPTFRLEDDTAHLRLGCNVGTAAVTTTTPADPNPDPDSGADIASGTLTVTSLVTTRKMCAPPAMDTEGHLLSVLAGEVTFVIDDDTLTLTNADGLGAQFLAHHPPTAS